MCFVGQRQQASKQCVKIKCLELNMVVKAGHLPDCTEKTGVGISLKNQRFVLCICKETMQRYVGRSEYQKHLEMLDHLQY